MKKNAEALGGKLNKVNDSKFVSKNWTDGNGNHQGGQSYGPGFAIAWQRGPMAGALEENQNGALVITVLSAVLDQVKYFQDSKFACEENALAIEHIQAALNAMNSRKGRRKDESKLGTHDV